MLFEQHPGTKCVQIARFHCTKLAGKMGKISDWQRGEMVGGGGGEGKMTVHQGGT